MRNVIKGNSGNQRKILAEISKINIREKELKRILIESVRNNEPIDYRIIQEIGLLQKMKGKLDKMMDKVKLGTRKAYNKFEDMVGAVSGKDSANMDRIIKRFELEDSQASILEDYIESLSDVAKKFMSQLSNLNKKVKEFEFPNTDGDRAKAARSEYNMGEDKLDVDVFVAMLNEFAHFYAGVVAAHQNGELLTKDANDIIARTRELLNTYSQDLDAAYRKLENTSKKSPLINEKKLHSNKLSHLLFEAPAGDAERARRTQIRTDRETAIGSDGETKEMLNNKSFAPIWRGAIAGALLGAVAGSAINASAILDKWFKPEIVDLEVVSKAPVPQEKLQSMLEPQFTEFYQLDGGVKKGEGLTQLVNRFTGANLTPKSSVQDFAKALEKMGGGDPQAAIDGLVGSGDSKGIFIDKEAAKKALNQIINNQGPLQDSTLGELFSDHRGAGGTNLLGTGKRAADALGIQINRDFIIQKAKEAATKVMDHPVAGPAIKAGKVVKVARQVSKGAAMLGTLGILAPWVLGGAAAGATIGALLRSNSLKSSRAKKIQDTIQAMEDVQEKDFTLPGNPVDVERTRTDLQWDKPIDQIGGGSSDFGGNRGTEGLTTPPEETSTLEQNDLEASFSKGDQAVRRLRTILGRDPDLMNTIKNNPKFDDKEKKFVRKMFGLSENRRKNIANKPILNENKGRINSLDLERWSILAGIKK
jgi:sulfur relay (sulfurtransferase) DsrC/TusE family protein